MTDKTKLIERIRETVCYFDDEFSKEIKTDANKLYVNLDVWKQPLCQYAGGVTANDLLDILTAFEQPVIREMTVDEIASFIHDDIFDPRNDGVSPCDSIAQALAKLGAIRIKDSNNE